MRETSASVSAARWLLGVTACVVLAFVLATGVSEYVEGSIATRSNEIISNAMPSIQMLARARGDLRRLDNAIDRYPGASADKKADLAAKITGLRDSVGVNLASYASLPLFPDERTLYMHAQTNFDDLQAHLARFLVHPATQEHALVQRDLDVFDDALERINTFDATEGQRLGLEIEHIRGQARATTVLLDAISVALAIIAAILAVRQFQRVAREQAVLRRMRDEREAELASQNEALGEFAGRVAHDILSPLTAAVLSFDLIRHTSSDPIAISGVERGTAAITRVHTLVDDLLTFSRAGGHPEPGASAAIGPVLGDIIEGLRVQAEQQRIELALAPVPEGSAACSEGVLTSIVSNLVRNALKYMGPAPVKRVDVRVRDADDRWRVEIEDTGPGIAPEHQQKIFEAYVQLDRSSAGVGLGLATVDRLVRAHGGTLGVISPVSGDRGSLFWFELPKWRAAETAAATSAVTTAAAHERPTA